MELNNTTQYAIRILSYIARNGKDRLISAKHLSEVLEIPYKFLTKIMTDLVKAEFVESIRGREGGFKLLNQPSSVTIMQVLQAFNELKCFSDCILGIGRCSNDVNQKCMLHDQWLEPKAQIEKMYRETTIDKCDAHKFTE